MRSTTTLAGRGAPAGLTANRTRPCPLADSAPSQ